MKHYTYPHAGNIAHAARTMPQEMRPNLNPICAIYEGALSDDECLEIAEYGIKEEPYKFKTCGAWTREMPRDSHLSVLKTVWGAATIANNHYWNFDLDPDPISWMQAYSQGGNYHIHTDGVVGQSRKLTAVVLLSREEDYRGGDLKIHTPDERATLPRTQGSIFVFPPWVWHEVTRITSGDRFTINMGFYGPPFK